jgi:acyl-CoA reductase-like NAD-dependent aldehyde dehydrogenase
MSLFTCVSPVDDAILASRAFASDTAISDAVTAARAAQRNWRAQSVSARARLCHAFVDAMLSMQDEIIPELARQMGRPVRYGAGELRGFEERARHMISIADAALARVIPPEKSGFERFITREPLGIILTVAPWNYPYLTAVNSVVPALMAGNAVILKHAAQTLLVGERFQMAADKAGFPHGLLQNLALSHDQTARLIGSGSIDMVCFTGSVEAGKVIERAAAGAFIPVGLELGGKDPAYVRADANLPFAIENLVDGAFFNSGQSCCGIERIYVHESLFDAFVDGFVALTKSYILGDPLDSATTLGPMVKTSAADFVRNQISDAVAAGAKAHLDPAAFLRDETGTPYIAPQVLTNVTHDMSVMRDESFGPVIGIMRVSDDGEAIRLMNDSRFGLTASIWSEDVEATYAIAAQIETGTVFLNRCDYLDPALAWTGVKDTGRGATLGTFGYEHLTRPKSHHFRLDTKA